MAIVIPSKNIYQKENPKVRDNVIERIEVGAIEVVPDNEYDVTVYNKNILLITNNYIIESNTEKEKLDYSIESDPIVPSNLHYYRAYAYIDSNAEYAIGTIQIPKLNNNKFVSTINYGTDKQKIESSLFISKKVSQITGTLNIIGYGGIGPKTINTGSATISQVTSFPNMPTKITRSQSNANVTLYGVNNNTNLTVNYKETDNNYEIEYKILKKLTEIQYSGAGTISSSSGSTATLQGDQTEYDAEKIEITVYGNTIGIDLQDKTVYINGETQKKVHSFDGNELMQTTNYIKDTGENAIEKMYGDTQLAYSRGKETATIRCSISDYYEENGEKAISIDKSTGRMSFKIGDKIIPMVYTSGGVDRAMSNYQDGSPKVFEVLGVRKYYDGAVWQELSSQEVAKNEEVSLFVNVNTGELFVSYADTAETAPIEFSYAYPYLKAEIADGVSGTLKLEDGKVILEK